MCLWYISADAYQLIHGTRTTHVLGVAFFSFSFCILYFYDLCVRACLQCMCVCSTAAAHGSVTLTSGTHTREHATIDVTRARTPDLFAINPHDDERTNTRRRVTLSAQSKNTESRTRGYGNDTNGTHEIRGEKTTQPNRCNNVRTMTERASSRRPGCTGRTWGDELYDQHELTAPPLRASVCVCVCVCRECVSDMRSVEREGNGNAPPRLMFIPRGEHNAGLSRAHGRRNKSPVFISEHASCVCVMCHSTRIVCVYVMHVMAVCMARICRAHLLA